MPEEKSLRAIELIGRLRPKMFQVWMVEALFTRLMALGILIALFYPFNLLTNTLRDSLTSFPELFVVIAAYLILVFFLLNIMLITWSIVNKDRHGGLDDSLTEEINASPVDPYMDVIYPSVIVLLYLIAWQTIYSLHLTELSQGSAIQVLSAALRAVLLLYFTETALVLISTAWIGAIKRLWVIRIPDSLLISSTLLAVEEALAIGAS